MGTFLSERVVPVLAARVGMPHSFFLLGGFWRQLVGRIVSKSVVPELAARVGMPHSVFFCFCDFGSNW